MINTVKEAIKYPFNDTKQVLLLGILTGVMGLIAIIPNLGIGFIAMPVVIQNINPMLLVSLGLLLLLLSIIQLIISLLINGYSYRIINLSLNRQMQLPELNNWKNMFIDGLKLFVVEFIYLLAFGVFCLIVAIIGTAIASLLPEIGALIVLALFGIICIIGFIITILVSNMAIVHVVKNDGDIAKGFDYKEILNIISQIGWGKYILILILSYIFTLVVMLVLGVLFAILLFLIAMTNIPTLLAILGLVFFIITYFLIVPYFTLFSSRLIGSIYNLKDY